MAEATNKMLTIGHSTMALDLFLSLLTKAEVTAIADVRSSPFSRRVPHFNRGEIRAVLKQQGIKYVFLGKELGGRPLADNLYRDGVADYEKMALEPAFHKGIERVVTGSSEHRIALMCSEHNPLDCHRCLLVGRALSERQVPLGHILTSEEIVDQRDIEEKLLNASGDMTGDMFSTREERLATAYRLRAKNVAYRKPSAGMAEATPLERCNHGR